MLKSVKNGVGLAALVAVLAGCSSTDTQNTSESALNAGNTVTPEVTTPVEPEVVSLENVIYFDFDKSLLRPEVRSLLVQHAEQLKASPASLRLEGHASEEGTREYNLALGERRANAVRDFLIMQGVDASTLEVISYGEEQPAVLGSDESARSQNRRVVLN